MANLVLAADAPRDDPALQRVVMRRSGSPAPTGDEVRASRPGGGLRPLGFRDRAAQQARDLHLRDAEQLRDLTLQQIVSEAQIDDPALAARKPAEPIPQPVGLLNPGEAAVGGADLAGPESRKYRLSSPRMVGWRRSRGGTALRVEALDGLDQADGGDLHEIVPFAARWIPAREVAGERHHARNNAVAHLQVARAPVALEGPQLIEPAPP